MTVKEFISIIRKNYLPNETISFKLDCTKCQNSGINNEVVIDNADNVIESKLCICDCIVPINYHITEVTHVIKKTVDCGGTYRKKENSILQIWFSENDPNHRLEVSKIIDILEVGFNKTPINEDNELLIEYQMSGGTMGTYSLDVNNLGNELLKNHSILGEKILESKFILKNINTDCLAKEKCGINCDC